MAEKPNMLFADDTAIQFAQMRLLAGAATFMANAFSLSGKTEQGFHGRFN